MQTYERIIDPLFFSGTQKVPQSPKLLQVLEIDRYLAKKLNKIWHSRLPEYDTGFCLNSLISFGAIYENIIYAIAIWTNPVAANLPQKEWLELRRMAIAPDAPKYTATYMLGKMAKIIAKRFNYVDVLVSYQDCEVHTGTIYKAANWKPDHLHQGGSWNRPNAKNLNGKPRTRPDKNNATGPKQRWVYEIKRPERLKVARSNPNQPNAMGKPQGGQKCAYFSL